MKIVISVAFSLLLCLSTFSQMPTYEQFGFKIIQSNDATSVKNQQRSGTCWSFSTVSFLESEMIRMGKDPVDLSELFIVRGIYREKAENYILRQGHTNFSQGALAHDVIHGYEKYGIVPQQEYAGLPKGTDVIDHSEMTAVLNGVVEAIVENKGGKYWRDAIDALLDVYMGDPPKLFSFKGKSYTPRQFADEVVGVKAEDYIELTSFTHIPNYREFILEVPDNFSSGSYYNLPLDELVEVTDYALEKGYTVVWDCDVSEETFNASEGYAILPIKGDNVKDELMVTPELRQQAYENYATTDDHLMHITGIAEDKDGKRYYMVKNSWGNIGPMEGYIYTSLPYFRMKTIGIMVHKEAIPKDIRNRIFKN